MFSQSSSEWSNVEVVRAIGRRHELLAKVLTALLQCPAHLRFRAHREETSGEYCDWFHFAWIPRAYRILSSKTETGSSGSSGTSSALNALANGSFEDINELIRICITSFNLIGLGE
jgi:hypothetical protein